jgi:hypothetical protein
MFTALAIVAATGLNGDVASVRSKFDSTAARRAELSGHRAGHSYRVVFRSERSPHKMPFKYPDGHQSRDYLKEVTVWIDRRKTSLSPHLLNNCLDPVLFTSDAEAGTRGCYATVKDNPTRVVVGLLGADGEYSYNCVWSVPARGKIKRMWEISTGGRSMENFLTHFKG